MNFEISDDARAIGEEARTLLQRRQARAAARQLLDCGGHDQALWQTMGELGWLGVNIGTDDGGAQAGVEALCMLAQELGHALAAVPFASTVYLFADAVAQLGTPQQRSEQLSAVAAGRLVGTLALAEGLGETHADTLACRVRGGRLSGRKWPVVDGLAAQRAVVVAWDHDAGGEAALFLVRLDHPGVQRAALAGIDPSRELAQLVFDRAPAERLGTQPHGPAALERMLARAAVPMAFEQIGGAQACLDMAVAYAKTRYAFGRPIGSFQAIKHKLADVYIALELARSNAYFAAWALAHDAPELPQAAAAARISASEAYLLAAKENIQTHGGLGVTWEADCHLYLRRGRHLGLALGGLGAWKDRLAQQLAKTAPQRKN
ncbi:acyl-CoA dehydrogenase family protein [Pseudorhodoferax sp. Leaf267]|uniref:acyl-CoA dehydrogenase family protein n=1 Tax=Pseudorhodoferax sp. Leaf267 TaxID=1736316 RepID=UPI0006F24F49|nr:acyl-CoA dehydrogenase family protein [Pseudorhodoferax sp. Leaf267]KQP14185.1 hypothetical protein ASF43_15245 [Pseudorhodoferax sp. Leaf267]